MNSVGKIPEEFPIVRSEESGTFGELGGGAWYKVCWLTEEGEWVKNDKPRWSAELSEDEDEDEVPIMIGSRRRHGVLDMELPLLILAPGFPVLKPVKDVRISHFSILLQS
nr:hypothetical protein Iba_chr04fCG3840 [Ipomoea batatas]